MGETTVLYALTTLAQSCAALAAFVGALGVFRMQMLRDQKRAAERSIRERTQQVIGHTGMFQMPLATVFQMLEHESDRNPTSEFVVAAVASRYRWEAFAPRMLQARAALVRLEVWTLGVIGVSMIGFNFIPRLKDARWMPLALAAVVFVTVVVTLWSVVVWTGKVEE